MLETLEQLEFKGYYTLGCQINTQSCTQKWNFYVVCTQFQNFLSLEFKINFAMAKSFSFLLQVAIISFQKLTLAFHCLLAPFFNPIFSKWKETGLDLIIPMMYDVSYLNLKV